MVKPIFIYFKDWENRSEFFGAKQLNLKIVVKIVVKVVVKCIFNFDKNLPNELLR